MVTPSAVFAALTAVFDRAGVQGVDSDPSILMRSGFILMLLASFVSATGMWRNPSALPRAARLAARRGAAGCWLLASALAASASWICYFRAEGR